MAFQARDGESVQAEVAGLVLTDQRVVKVWGDFWRSGHTTIPTDSIQSVSVVQGRNRRLFNFGAIVALVGLVIDVVYIALSTGPGGGETLLITAGTVVSLVGVGMAVAGILSKEISLEVKAAGESFEAKPDRKQHDAARAFVTAVELARTNTAVPVV